MSVGSAAALARESRALVEASLDTLFSSGSWPWSRRLSTWIDMLITIEESGA